MSLVNMWLHFISSWSDSCAYSTIACISAKPLKDENSSMQDNGLNLAWQSAGKDLEQLPRQSKG